jgi:hypothetical protein
MEREQRSDDQTRPGPAGREPQHLEQQHRVHEMEHEVLEVRGAGVHAEHLAVEHVRQHRDRVPVAGALLRECPDDVGGLKAGRDVRILRDVDAVVVVLDEAEAERARVDGERRGEHGEQGRDEPFRLRSRAAAGSAASRVRGSRGCGRGGAAATRCRGLRLGSCHGRAD